MTGGEDGAAVLVGQDGCVEGADVAGDLDNFLLVHADQGTEDGLLHHVLGDRHRRHGLAGHLSQTLAGDQSASAHPVCDHLRNAHHEPAHGQGEVGLRTAPAQLLLDAGEGDDVHGQATAVAGQQAGQLQHLLLGLVGGVRVAEEMHHLQCQAALGHHVAGHRGVNAAGEQCHSTSAHTHRQAASARLRVGVDIAGKVADFQVDDQLRIVDVHLQMRVGFREQAAYVLAQLDGGHGEGLVAALGLHLEALGVFQVLVQIGTGGLEKGVRVLLAGFGTGQAHDAKQLLHGLPCAVQIAGLLQRFHVDDGLTGDGADAAVGVEAALEVAHQPLFKATAVQAFQDDLAHLQ